MSQFARATSRYPKTVRTNSLLHQRSDVCPRYSHDLFDIHAHLAQPRRPQHTMADMNSKSGTMSAAVIHEPGGPETFKIEKRPIPKAVREALKLCRKPIPTDTL